MISLGLAILLFLIYIGTLLIPIFLGKLDTGLYAIKKQFNTKAFAIGEIVISGIYEAIFGTILLLKMR